MRPSKPSEQDALTVTHSDCRRRHRRASRSDAGCESGGTGLYLPGNGVRALRALGLADKVLARAVCMSHQRILDHTGRQLAEIDLAKVWNAVGPCVGIARGELHRILLEGTGYLPGLTIAGLR